MEHLIVYQIKVTRDYENSHDYMIFESGNFRHPLLVLNELEAKKLRDDLDAALRVHKGDSNEHCATTTT